MTRQSKITLRAADASHAKRIHALITANQQEGKLLPRTLEEVTVHAERFVVAVRGRAIVGCAELAPLSPQVAEVRSLAVDGKSRHLGVGAMLVDEVRARARREGFERFTAFTHTPGYFSRMGFSIVPHLWVTEKIHADCVKCPLFRTCGQYAMVTSLEDEKGTRDHGVTVHASSPHA
ncbi:MAG TPA: GNAT family N-acetyltransferase [Vicinamibacterales bacterium]|jgi:amino-acid N-acetyltransferase|nr:GNAT family N-acetyltransferase [Vicinamibacterales bacterium]